MQKKYMNNPFEKLRSSKCQVVVALAYSGGKFKSPGLYNVFLIKQIKLKAL